MMERLKSGLIASLWRSPQSSILAAPEKFIYTLYIKQLCLFPPLLWHNLGYHRQLQKRRSDSVGTKEYIQVVMLLKDHPLEAVTAAVERALRSGLYGYEVIKTALRGESAKRPCESPTVWPNRVDHFDQLLQRSGGA